MIFCLWLCAWSHKSHEIIFNTENSSPVYWVISLTNTLKYFNQNSSLFNDFVVFTLYFNNSFRYKLNLYDKYITTTGVHWMDIPNSWRTIQWCKFNRKEKIFICFLFASIVQVYWLWTTVMNEILQIAGDYSILQSICLIYQWN